MSSPWECHHDLADIAARLGRSPQTVRRMIEADPELRAAAKCWSGTVWLPASALAAWWARLPGLDAAPVRVVARRSVRGRFFNAGQVTAGRTPGEAMRRASNG